MNFFKAESCGQKLTTVHEGSQLFNLYSLAWAAASVREMYSNLRVQLAYIAYGVLTVNLSCVGFLFSLPQLAEDNLPVQNTKSFTCWFLPIKPLLKTQLRKMVGTLAALQSTLAMTKNYNAQMCLPGFCGVIPSWKLSYYPIWTWFSIALNCLDYCLGPRAYCKTLLLLTATKRQQEEGINKHAIMFRPCVSPTHLNQLYILKR